MHKYPNDTHFRAADGIIWSVSHNGTTRSIFGTEAIYNMATLDGNDKRYNIAENTLESLFELVQTSTYNLPAQEYTVGTLLIDICTGRYWTVNAYDPVKSTEPTYAVIDINGLIKFLGASEMPKTFARAQAYQAPVGGTYHVTLPSGSKIVTKSTNDPFTAEDLGMPTYRRIGDSIDIKIKSPDCNHTYKEYHGFTDYYQYCTKCDHKKDL